MTLPASGPLTIAQIQAEIDGVGAMPVTIPNADWRTLAGKPTGSLIIPNDFWGKSWRTLAITHTDTGATTSNNLNGISLGDATAGRLIVVVLYHHDVGSNPGTTPAMTLNGNAMTRHVARSSGSGGGAAAGCAIFSIVEPTGTTGDFAVTDVSWAGLPKSIVVYRATGYTFGAAAGDSVGGISATSFPFILNPATDGAMICAFATASTSGFTHSWTNATEVAESAFGQTNKCSWTLNDGLTAGARTITPTVSSSDFGSSVGITLTPS